jgi:hypothetical protein
VHFIVTLPLNLDNVIDNLTTKTGFTYKEVTNRLTDLVSIHKSRKNKDEDGKTLKGRDKAKGKGKEKTEKANKAEISKDEHRFVASVSDNNGYGMKATSRDIVWLYDTASSIHMTRNSFV